MSDAFQLPISVIQSLYALPFMLLPHGLYHTTFFSPFFPGIVGSINTLNFAIHIQRLHSVAINACSNLFN